jgi:hypothetical protein
LSNVARLRHIQNLCGFSKPTAMVQSFIMTLYKPYISILKFNDSRSENYRRPSLVNPTEHYSGPVPGNIAKKFGFEKLTGFLNHKPDLI